MRYILWLLLTFIFTTSLYSYEEIRIGVRAHSGLEAAQEKWGESIKALDNSIKGYKVKLVPIVGFEEVDHIIANKDIDFILTNPTQYSIFEVKYGAVRIATLRNLRIKGGVKEFSSIIFTKANRDDIKTLQNLKNKSILGLKKKAFGAWQMAHRELLKNGIDPFKDMKVRFDLANIQEEIVLAVLAEKVDSGTVRTGILEKMLKEGKIKPNEIKIINLKDDDFPLLHSTELYPEWAFATLPHVPLELSKEMAIALLQIQPQDKAAIKGNYTGWDIPLDYTQVHEILKELKVFPYEHYGEITLKDLLKEYKFQILFLILVVMALLLYNLHVKNLNKNLQEQSYKLNVTNIELAKATTALTEFSHKLKQRVKEEVEHNQEKDHLVFQQSKMAAMGEMTCNIAHQWRQPIAVISMWANNIIADIDMGEVENKSLKKYVNNINEQTKHLSKTIDDFRNFFSPNKEQTTFKIRTALDKTISLMAASCKNYNIEIIENIEDIEITALENELTQALLNIIKNAKDILITMPVKQKRLLFINIYQNNSNAIIEVVDNAGGIDTNILDKIFEPYFTTKHKSLGTGIGLYMTESIITKHLNGKISASNTTYEYQGVSYVGAKFLIELPTQSLSV